MNDPEPSAEKPVPDNPLNRPMSLLAVGIVTAILTFGFAYYTSGNLLRAGIVAALTAPCLFIIVWRAQAITERQKSVAEAKSNATRSDQSSAQ